MHESQGGPAAISCQTALFSLASSKTAATTGKPAKLVDAPLPQLLRTNRKRLGISAR
jgi:hypothetical protein